MLYPWQQPQWQHMVSNVQHDTLAHGFLFSGPKGVGKETFADEFAQYLLCHQNVMGKDKPCGQCPSCLLIASGMHPDIKIIAPEGASETIQVDQIRELIHYLSLRPHHANHKVAILYAADRMNVNAANSLLKSLEEPPTASMLILTTCRPNSLLPTIKSRCQEVVFPIPDSEISRPWLATRLEKQDQSELYLSLAHGAPLAALELANSQAMEQRLQIYNDLSAIVEKHDEPVQVAGSWKKIDIAEVLYWVWSFITDMARLKVSQYPPQINNPDLSDRMRKLIKEIPLKNLVHYVSRVENAQRFVQGNMNQQLLLEELLINWSALKKAKPKEVMVR